MYLAWLRAQKNLDVDQAGEQEKFSNYSGIFGDEFYTIHPADHWWDGSTSKRYGGTFHIPHGTFKGNFQINDNTGAIRSVSQVNGATRFPY
jgi:hypothetical protein